MRKAGQWHRLLLVAGMLIATRLAAGERGVEVLVEERCQKCHGMEGQSSSPLYPKLAGQNLEYLQRQMFNFKLGRRINEKMKRQVADLSGAEVEALAAYFSSKKLIPDIAFDPALAEIGRKLYFDGNPQTEVTACVTCHGPEAHGALFLPRLAGQHASYIERQLRAFIEFSRQSPEMVMHTVVANISEAEIVAVAQYLSGLE